MKTTFAFLLCAVLGGALAVRAEDAPTSKLVERIQDKVGHKLSPMATAKIVEAEKTADEKTKAAHTAFLKQVAEASGFSEDGIKDMLTAEELMKGNADSKLVAAIEGALTKPLKPTERRAVAKAVRDRKQAIQPVQDKLAQAVNMYGGLRRDQVDDVLKSD